jgi:hypothetical protein
MGGSGCDAQICSVIRGVVLIARAEPGLSTKTIADNDFLIG